MHSKRNSRNPTFGWRHLRQALAEKPLVASAQLFRLGANDGPTCARSSPSGISETSVKNKKHTMALS